MYYLIKRPKINEKEAGVGPFKKLLPPKMFKTYFVKFLTKSLMKSVNKFYFLGKCLPGCDRSKIITEVETISDDVLKRMK